MTDRRWNRRGGVACTIALAAAAACGTLDAANPDPLPDVADAGREPEDAFVAPTPDPDTGVDAPPPPTPISIISPYRDGGLVYPERTTWTVAATENAELYYTTDGTDPMPGTKASGSFFLTNPPNGTVIKWRVGTDPTVHRFDVKIDASDGGPKAGAGFIFTGLRFQTSNTVVATVPSDAGSTQFLTNLRMWNQQGCPDCIDFITVGIDKPSDCLGYSVPGVYPGVLYQNQQLRVTVPQEAGVYAVRSGFSQSFDCDAALGTPLSDTQIGVLVVTP